MKDKVKVLFKNLHDFSEIETSNLRIEYGGYSIEFRDGKIYGCLCEEPEEPSSFCETWNDCKLRLLSAGCLPDAQCVHRVKPARRPNMPPVMHL